MTLLLFDIDGTLVRINEAGRAAVTKALSSITSRPISTDGVPFSGRTDPAIFESVLSTNDVSPEATTVDDAIEAYVDAMRTLLAPEEVEVLPGVQDLLSALQDHPNVHLGLVTGNVKPVAHKKLALHDLAHYFSVGAYGSDHADRNQLPEIAVRRAAKHTGHAFHASDHAVVIGDTVHDIACARATGARAVAVCTGRYDQSDLSRHNPDLLFETLPSPETFVRRVVEKGA